MSFLGNQVDKVVATPLPKFNMEPEMVPWNRRFLLETINFRFRYKSLGSILYVLVRFRFESNMTT